jgi:hypothetical protein
VPTVPESPGDKISAEARYNGSQFTLTIANETAGKSFSKKSKVAAKRSSAEFVVEAPSSDTGILPRSDFGKTSLGQDFTAVNDTNYATNGSVTGPISDFGGSVKEIIMVNGEGKDKAVPSALKTDGSSFRVAWKSE